DLLAEIPQLSCPKPTGAFYVFPDVGNLFGLTTPGGRTLGSAMDVCEALLDEVGVALVPGEDFGGCGEHCARISFACDEATIVDGMGRLKTFVKDLH
ncbi:MAG: aminotransferase class I/II-fold pyridoxal phosphate-dependent enzyme, partial [Planctomycetota bacterium]